MRKNSVGAFPVQNPIWKTVRKHWNSLRRNARLFHAANSRARVTRWHAPEAAMFSGSYFVSTDRGVFAIEGGELLQLTRQETYGMAVRDGRLYLAVSSDDYSCICSARLPDRLEEGSIVEPEEHYRVPIHKSGRVHQIAFYGDLLALAETVSNGVTLKTPFAQVYEIVGTDGWHFDEPPSPRTWSEVNGLLESVLGPPIYESEVAREIEEREDRVRPAANIAEFTFRGFAHPSARDPAWTRRPRLSRDCE